MSLIRTVASAVSITVVASGLVAAAAGVAGADGPNSTLTTCDEASFDAAVAKGGTVTFGVGCVPLNITHQIVIGKNLHVAVENTNPSQRVTLDAQNLSRFFDVEGGSLTLVGITLQHGRVTGVPGAVGKAGGDGTDGDEGSSGGGTTSLSCGNGSRAANGGDGKAGKPGTQGGTGADGTPGGSASGGALLITSGVVELTDDTFDSNQTAGGAGGAGNAGGKGGRGGGGGAGGVGSEGEGLLGCPGGGNGGQGAKGGAGGGGGAGGTGGAGGAAYGGTIANAGTLLMTRVTVTNSVAEAGAGGVGAAGGDGGNAGSGGAGGTGGNGDSSKGGPGGDGGPGGAAGAEGAGAAGGDGGRGGVAEGGAVDNTGSIQADEVSLSGKAFAGDSGNGGAGGSGGFFGQGVPLGGDGGFGGGGTDGDQGAFSGGSGNSGGRGARAGDGGPGGKGAPGPVASGGALENDANLLGGVLNLAGEARAGAGGTGGASGTAGTGTLGGGGGPGGYGAPGGGGGGASGAGGPGGISGTAVIGGASAIGGQADGGAVANRGRLTITKSLLVDGGAEAGQGGRGGRGGASQDDTEGESNNGGQAGYPTSGTSPGGSGGRGGDSGSGGAPGTDSSDGPGAPGSDGGAAFGGGLANLAGATALIVHLTAESGDAQGGAGGQGGYAGVGGCGAGGTVCTNAGGTAGNVTSGAPGGAAGEKSPPGDGGGGGDGGDGISGAAGVDGRNGGHGGNGGGAQGGGVYNHGTLAVVGATVKYCHADGGAGGNGGVGGAGSAGGAGGAGSNAGNGGPADPGAAGGGPGSTGGAGNGAAAGQGGNGGDGGAGGTARGGGLFTDAKTWSLTQAVFDSDRATGGAGAAPGAGGAGGPGGNGGNGGGAGQPGAQDSDGGDGSPGGSGGHGGSGGAEGNGGQGGDTSGSALFTTTKATAFSAVRFTTDSQAHPTSSVTAGVGGAAHLAAGAPGTGGTAGRGGSGSSGTNPPTDDESHPGHGEPGPDGKPGKAGDAGTYGTPGVTGALVDPVCHGTQCFTGYTVADPPTLTSVQAQPNGIGLYWDAPANDGAKDITGYVATVYAGGKAVSTTHFTAKDYYGVIYTFGTITGLKNDVAYSVRMATINEIGTGALSVAADPVTPRRADAAPTAPTITATKAGNGQVALTWTAGSEPLGRLSIQGWQAYAYSGGSQVASHYFPPGTTGVFTGLTNGTAYTFTMDAYTPGYTGAASTQSAAVTPSASFKQVPDPLYSVSATPGAAGATVKWTASATDGGSAITGYVVTPFQDGYAQPAVTFRSSATTQRVTGLANGEPYTFRVAAMNAVGAASDSTVESAAVTPHAYLPFSSDAALISRVYADLAGRNPTAAERADASSALDLGTLDTASLATKLVTSSGVSGVLGPVTRLYRDCIHPIPDRAGLSTYVAARRKGTSLSSLATRCVASSGYRARYAKLSNSNFVGAVYATALGHAASRATVTALATKLDKHKITRAAVLTSIGESPASRTAQAGVVDVVDLWDLLMHTTPSPKVVAAGVTALEHGTLASYVTTLVTSAAFASTVH